MIALVPWLQTCNSAAPIPGQEQKEAIWQIYLDQYELHPAQPRPDDQQWTGAEIKSCCRLAALLDLPLVQAAQNFVPVAVTAAESVDQLRQWASGRCLSADAPGVYRAAKSTSKPASSKRASGKRRRSISSEPSAN